MGLVKRITRSRVVQETLGFLVAVYLKFVQRTNRFVMEPADAYDRIEMPVIAAMWHGQHFMIHFAKRPQDRAASLVSRSGDGEFNAIALRHLGVRAIRGSGARGRDIRKKGGAQAMRAMLRALSDGEMVVMTADIPKISRICGQGIVTLAQLSGRPIVPVAVVTSRRIDFDSWDKASIGLPFGRGAMVLGEPVHVPREADDTTLERSRDGLGIGLTLVRNLVELHRGTITVRSEGRGRGSEFVVRLPRVAPGDAMPETQNGTGTPPTACTLSVHWRCFRARPAPLIWRAARPLTHAAPTGGRTTTERSRRATLRQWRGLQVKPATRSPPLRIRRLSRTSSASTRRRSSTTSATTRCTTRS